MKLILFLILLSCSIGSSMIAQNLGSIQRGQRGYTPNAPNPVAGEPEPPDVNLLSQERADMYQDILSIDDFQKEVLKTFCKYVVYNSGAFSFWKNLTVRDKRSDKDKATYYFFHLKDR